MMRMPVVVLRESAVEANHMPVFATVLWGCTVIVIYVNNVVWDVTSSSLVDSYQH